MTNEQRNNANILAQMGLPELQSLLWDLYKDVRGVRPRHLTVEFMNDAEKIKELVLRLLEELKND